MRARRAWSRTGHRQERYRLCAGAESASMFFMRTLTVAALLCASVVVTAHSNIPKYGSRVYSIDRQTNFSKLTTYSWLESHLVADADLHAQIVAAVDRELAAAGMTKVPPGLGEVGVTYEAYSRTDVAVYEHQ